MLRRSRLTVLVCCLTMALMVATAPALLEEIEAVLAGRGTPAPVTMVGEGSARSVFAVSGLAQASVAAAGAAMASLMAEGDLSSFPAVTVDGALTEGWFQRSIIPIGWELPPVWDSVAGDYEAEDGWIKLHTNAPHHRLAALAVLGVPADCDAVTKAVAGWKAQALEEAVVAAGGAAAAMRSVDDWRQHPQGRAVAAEPLVHWERTSGCDRGHGHPLGPGDRPLTGVRVLDLTRVLAGPVATRLLAGWGANVLRIDPPDWDEPALAPDMTLGKRCARVDLRAPDGRDRILDLLGSADVLVHGYRSDALDRLGLEADLRSERRPCLVDVSLDAYGWSGPWRIRRGFDSLVQMSVGIADAGRRAAGSDRPVPLPFQALDHATGYMMAAAAINGLGLRRTEGTGSRWRLSLARTAMMLIGAGVARAPSTPERAPRLAVVDAPIERTVWGDARRLPAPLTVEGAPLRWTLPPRPLGSDRPCWEV
jgi:crotonobetainyl-CoA:carnitine CoA-transferase CaiB-like acyl-CoA transferase